MSKISYYSLTEKKPEKYISYLEKLSTKEWSEKRDSIIKRDKFTCNTCKLTATIFEKDFMYRKKTEEETQEYKKDIANSFYNAILPEFKSQYDKNTLPQFLTFQKNLIIKPEQIILQVHHKYYILNNLPWNYLDDSLITLCDKCHQKIHNVSDIPIYSDNSMEVKLDYTKCGTCNGSGYIPEYHYYMNGICFDCSGNKYIELK